jgi:hypothetical protein
MGHRHGHETAIRLEGGPTLRDGNARRQDHDRDQNRDHDEPEDHAGDGGPDQYPPWWQRFPATVIDGGDDSSRDQPEPPRCRHTPDQGKNPRILGRDDSWMMDGKVFDGRIRCHEIECDAEETGE